MIIGYARISTTGQTAGLAAQERDLANAGAEKIHVERISGMTHRPRLLRRWRSSGKAMR